MKVILAKHYGLCFGVRDAIAQAERLAKVGSLTILGELVHNPIVRDRLVKRGVVEGALDRPGSAATPQVMITAHGASDAARSAWRSANYGVADGTCPLVRHAHQQLKTLIATAHFPVIVGKRGHVEVNGLCGDFPQAVVVETNADIALVPQAARYGVISQTTQPIEKVLMLVAELRSSRPESEVRFVDTVCQPTKDRQASLRQLIAEADTIVVVGGHNSNNTLQLLAAASAAGRRAFHVESAIELEEKWFEESEVIGVTAGTSTLKETVGEVVQRLEQLAGSARAAAAE